MKFVVAQKKQRKGGIPYAALTIFAIALVIAATLYFSFGPRPPAPQDNASQANASPSAALSSSSPSTAPGASSAPSPSPSQSPSSSPSPSPTFGGWPSAPAAECSTEGCLSEKPYYCSGGHKISSCAKCGCPTGFVCGLGSKMLPCECLNETLVIANCTEYGPGGNWTTIIPSPSPSPSPTPPPCTASNYTAIYGNATPSDYYFRSNVSYAYNYVFGHNLTWTHPDYYLWIGSDVNNEQNVVSVSEGYYHGWTERDVVLQILANQSKCYKPTVIFYPPATVPPWDYEFKQNCWNWTFMVQANIKDIMPGSSSVNRGSAFAARVADICPP